MLVYLAKCFVILLALWFVRHLHMIPWNDMANLVVIVAVPLLIAAGAFRAGVNRGAQFGARYGIRAYRHIRQAGHTHMTTNDQTQ